MTTSSNPPRTPAAAEEKLLVLMNKMGAMKRHRAFAMINSVDSLQTFMEWHVYAVWDFMSLVKRLQIDFTSTTLPWLPPRNHKAARLINEIVLGEETDETLNGGHSSHFELYLTAMREVGASTVVIEEFVDLVRCGTPVGQALQRLNVPAPVARFVLSTIQTACDGTTAEVLGSFFYGREDPIPQMFKGVLESWTLDPKLAPTFVYYLERHIELDADSHGPAAKIIISETLGEDEQAWFQMLNAAERAIEQRVALWDALADALVESDINISA